MKTRHNSQSPAIRGAAEILMIFFILFLFGFLSIRSDARSFHQAEGRINAEQTNHSILRVRQIYTSQIGAREKQVNTGEEVKKYLRYVSLPQGHAWCAAFICWVYGEAGIVNPRTGWSPFLFTPEKLIWKRGESIQLKAGSPGRSAYPPRPGTHNPEPGTPRTGDIFAIWFPEKNRIAHAGFIDSWGDSWLITVEGNTNLNGSSEGDGVYRKRRLVKSIYQVARYIPEIKR